MAAVLGHVRFPPTPFSIHQFTPLAKTYLNKNVCTSPSVTCSLEDDVPQDMDRWENLQLSISWVYTPKISALAPIVPEQGQFHEQGAGFGEIFGSQSSYIFRDFLVNYK